MTHSIRACVAVLLASCAVAQSAEIIPLVTTNATWRLATGRTEASSPDLTTWRSNSFNDVAFSNAPAPFTYGESYPNGTLLDDMINNYTCFFLRRSFTVTNLAQIASLRLGAKVDDGFVVWINGAEVQRVNMPEAPGSPVTITNLANGATEPVPFVFYNFTGVGGYLVNGANTLAVQVFNTSLGSSDIVFDASLEAVLTETNPPVILSQVPAPGPVTNLTSITVTFSEPVSGVDANDFLINGFPVNSADITSNSVTFTFAQPAYGSVQIGWAAGHAITDQATPPNAFDHTAPSANWLYTLVDVVPPVVTALFPPPGATLLNLAQIEVTFSEDVLHLDAADLLINGQPATNVTYTPGGPFIFRFPPAAAGGVSVAWAGSHGITDLAAVPNPFAGGAWSYTVNPSATVGNLVINEFLARNETGLVDEDNEAQPWIEIYNRGATTVNLANYALSDDPELPGLWSFPARALAPGAYLVVFASGKDIKSPTGTNRFHTNFKLNGHGEHLGLYSPDSPRVLISGFSPAYPEQRNDRSYGPETNGVFRYFDPPTPGGPNGISSIVGVIPPVHFGVARGFFTQPFNLTLSCETRGAQIRYTTDGREPTELTGTIYSAPLALTATAVIRAAAFRTNYLPADSVTHTYIFNASAAIKSLPVLSLVTATNNLYGPSGIVGIGGGTYNAGSGLWIPASTNDYHNPSKHGVAWERPLSFEMIKPGDNSGFQVNGGIRAHGSDYTRPRYRPTDKFAYRVYFRGAYGPGKLEYPFFEGSSVQSFDQIILRAGHNDLNPFIRDEMTRRLHANEGAVTIHGNLVNLFINGQYIGYFNPTERPDENWISSTYQSEKRWDVIKQFNSVVNGDLVEYNSINSYIAGQDVTQPAIYQEVARRFDVTNFVDYLCLNIYEAMGDWPANNWVATRERSTNGVWRYAVWDGEWGCGIYGASPNLNTFTLAGGGPSDSGLASIGSSDIARNYQRLYLNPEFRLLFADRIQRNFFNNGALTDTNISLLHTALRAAMLPVLPSYDNAIATTWIPARRAVLMGQFNQYGLLASSNAPVFNQFGGRVPRGFNLTLVATNGGGTIYYTTNGGDPRVMFSGAVAANATTYAGPLVLGQTTVVRARTLNGTNWSAVTEATFEVASLGVPLRLTEIMYNPIGGSLYEFVELQNLGTTPLDLSGMFFEGITYLFPPNSSLAAGARLVLGSNTDPIPFAVRYPGVTVFDRFAGSLNNAGERLTLRDRFAQIITSVDYHDNNGWPTRADGAGYSLEVVDAQGDPDDAANWRASAAINGTPGAAPAPPAVSDVRLNEIMATNFTSVANSGTHPDWIELHNTGAGSATLTGWSLTDDGNARKFVFPATTLPAGGFLVVWADDATNTTPGLHLGFSLSHSGDNVQLYDAATNLVDALGFGLQLPDYSLGRVGATWVLNTPTPDAANVAAAVASPTNLVINEWLANALPAQPDWIELFNPAALPVALRGCWFTTTSVIHQITSLSFVGAGGFVQLFADENAGADHLDLKLSAVGETISFYDPLATLVNSVTYSNALEGVSRGRLPDGSASVVNFVGTASPGASNYAASYAGPVLNEVLARNVSAVTNGGRVADYLELFNASGSPFSLAGMSLSVDGLASGQWTFPPGAAIGANSYLVVWCDGGRVASTNAGDYNTGRALNGDSGGAYLFNAAGQLVNSVEYGFQVENRPIGLSGGQWRLLATTTPGAANSAVAPLGINSTLRINEWMANPDGGADWFELFNPAALPVDLSGLILTDDLTTFGTNQFRIAPLSFIAPTGFVKWTADGNLAQGRDHVNFSLDADGDALRLYTANGSNALDTVAFGAQALGVSQGRLGDGAGTVLGFPGSATPGESNYRLIGEAVINEVLTHASNPLEDTIELRNPTGAPASIGGWFLSDSAAVLKKFRIADGTTIPAGGFIQFLESQFNPGGTNAFTLDRARGGELWLSAADGIGNLSGFRARVKFGAAADGVSFGRYEVAGGLDFPAQSARTLGATNAGPLVGPVVIHEIMYNPPGGVGATEFIELRNITGAPVDLFDPARPTNCWRLGDGIDFSFPPGTTLAASGYLLVVDFDPALDPTTIANFRAHYGVSPAVPVLGPYAGKLANGGETIELFRPDLPDGAFLPFVLVDKVNYGTAAPWPSGLVEGGGYSLQRRNASAYGNDAANWLAATPTAGGANVSSPVAPPVIVQSPVGTNTLTGVNILLQAAATGSGPLAWQWRFNGAALPGQTNASLLLDYLRLDDAGAYDVFAVNSGGPAFSAVAQVSVAELPVILSAPPGIYATNGGSNVTFTVINSGTPPLQYRWQFNGADIPGANAPTIALTNLSYAHMGNYTFSVSNSFGGAATNLTLYVLIKPVITNGPQPQTVLQGGTATFNVTAGPVHALVPLGYRWLRNGAAFFTSSVPSVTISNVQASSRYQVVVTNLAGSSPSSPGAGITNLFVLADLDRDGVADLWELQYGFSTNNAADALLDFDGDGMNNRDEYLSGTNPTNALSVLKIVLSATNATELSFVAQTNLSYTVQWRTNLVLSAWSNLTSIIAQPLVRTIQVNTVTAPAGAERYLRIITPQAP